MAIIAGGGVRARVAPYLLQGDAITVDIQHSIGDSLAVRITCGTGVTCGMMLLGGAHTPCASMTRAASVAGHEQRNAPHGSYR